ncbi:hypothetical protein [Sphaerotilus sp.]|uniref:hypothetical protein n=1 Tax=Sphaerotilus sp. TaxID=2093942 RepID=UPI002ACE76B4|nr:hypothetical protein [Sphaerotilus sp.]MDZ7855825.1 hypothetical protein [Sphaerotilus sp.]
MQAADEDTDLPLPSLEALVAGTVALMTSWADPCVDARITRADQRSLLARKVVSNLFFMQNHPCASPALRQVMANAHQRWVGLAQVPATDSLGDHAGERSAALH